jgi:hypothetical protein
MIGAKRRELTLAPLPIFRSRRSLPLKSATAFTVCFHLAALIAKRLWRERTLATTRIASWDARFKGIDDAAVRNLLITSISVQQWLDRLSPRFRQIAMTRLFQIAGFPSEQSSGGRQKPLPTLFR